MNEHLRRLTSTPIAVPDDTIEDLEKRLRATRFTPDGVRPADGLGVTRSVLEPLVRYWADGYDWRRAEEAINQFDHYTVHIDGVPIHFMFRAGTGAHPMPLVLSHGWPWTFWHWSKVIDRLADPGGFGEAARSFDVIVPSLPGFGFSTPVGARTDLNFWKTADLWHKLMTETLGYRRYGAAGCDVGALITGQLGHKYSSSVIGIHIGSGQRLDLFAGDRAWDVTGGQPIPDSLPPEARARLIALERRFAVHLAAQSLAPETLAHALADSPAGMLAWLLERWTNWSDNGGDVETVFDRDDLLTHATIYWVGQSIGSSMRTYANNNRFPWTPSHDLTPVVQVPTGITLVGFENPPGVRTADERKRHFLGSDRSTWYSDLQVTAHDRGGHFIPWEIPAAWIDDLRRTFDRTQPAPAGTMQPT
jgi:pimeloyl-ACP methyl ester carboxylesterase